MTETKSGAFTFAEGYPPDVIAVTAHGHVTRADYERDLIPAVLGRVRQEGRVKILYEIGADFAGFSVGAMWDDAKLGLLHLSDFAKVAIVTDIDWMRASARIFAPLIPCPVAVFPLSDREAARDWITADGAERKPGRGADATHDIPALEDRIPPDA